MTTTTLRRTFLLHNKQITLAVRGISLSAQKPDTCSHLPSTRSFCFGMWNSRAVMRGGSTSSFPTLARTVHHDAHGGITKDNPPPQIQRVTLTADKDKKREGEYGITRSPVTSYAAAYFGIPEDVYFSPDRPLRWLVAMDFSDNGWRALLAAKQLFNKERGDHILVFNVPYVPLLDLGEDAFMWHGVDVVKEAIDWSMQQMEGVHKLYADIIGYYSCEVCQPGDARELVLLRCERKEEGARIDYAVCGQRGRSKLLNIMLGSVAIHLVHYSPTSVVVVR